MQTRRTAKESKQGMPQGTSTEEQTGTSLGKSCYLAPCRALEQAGNQCPMLSSCAPKLS